MKFVYLFNVEGTSVYKIGNSKHPEKRIAEVQTGCPFKVIEVARFKSEYPTQVETALHRRFGLQKTDEDGRELQGEFFTLSFDDRKMFLEHCQKAEDVFIILENNSYLQDKKKM
ncbi:MAG: GIY-YIG nuclease family protein [Nanoarchaeota archaeon]